MTATAPTTPARDQHFRFPCNRSFSLPTRIAQPHSLPVRHLNEEAQRVETLFSCATAKVVSFNAAAPGPGHVRHSSTPVGRLSEAEHAEHGTLPWTSATERTLAAGPLRIYRLPGSVSFLHSGALLHAILPRSQCWCVDGECIFVLRIRISSYYRIELPFDSAADRSAVERLMAVLQQVLHYEKFACPFKRDFDVQVPFADETPRRARRTDNLQRAKRWTLNRVWQPEDMLDGNSSGLLARSEDEGSHDDAGSPGRSAELSPRATPEPDWEPDTASPSGSATGPATGAGSASTFPTRATAPAAATFFTGRVMSRVRDFDAEDSDTLPQRQRASLSETVADSDASMGVDPKRERSVSLERTPSSCTSSTFYTVTDELPAPVRDLHRSDSFHSVLNFSTECPPDSPFEDYSFMHTQQARRSPDRGAVAARTATASHTSGPSELTVVGLSPARVRSRSLLLRPMHALESAVLGPLTQADGDDINGTTNDGTTSNGTDRASPSARSQPERTPLYRNFPNPDTRSPSPTPQRGGRRTRDLIEHSVDAAAAAAAADDDDDRSTASFLSKACCLLLGPPTQLLALMLRIAARIADRTLYHPSLMIAKDGVDWLPGRWDSSSDDDNEWDEQSDGMPMRILRRRRPRTASGYPTPAMEGD